MKMFEFKNNIQLTRDKYPLNIFKQRVRYV